MLTATFEGKRSPWGTIDHFSEIAPGIVFCGTPGHGGVHLDRARQKAMPKALKLRTCWYEEDCDWARVCCAFPEAFAEKDLKAAKDTLRNFFPDAYEAFYGEVIPAGESMVKDERAFRLRHANDYVCISARGDWHKDVPTGMVEVLAGKGGRQADGSYPADCKRFLVPETEYDARNGSFVIDTSRHQESSPID